MYAYLQFFIAAAMITENKEQYFCKRQKSNSTQLQKD